MCMWPIQCDLISYEQQTQLQFIDGNLNAQRYRDEILRPIVLPFIHHHHLIFQRDITRPHVARICTHFLEAEHVIPCPAYSTDMSTMFGMLWIGVYDSVSSSRQCPATLHNHWRGVGQHSKGHSQQPDQLYAKEMCPAAWGKWWSYQILTGFLIHAPTLFLMYLWPTDPYLYSQSCEINRLGPNEFILNDWFP